MGKEPLSIPDQLLALNLVPRKYYGQVFTASLQAAGVFADAVKNVYRPGTRVVEVGGGLGHLTELVAKRLPEAQIEVVELEPALADFLNKKFVQYATRVCVVQGDILEWQPTAKNATQNLQKDSGIAADPYLLVGNIPFHIAGRFFRKFMSDLPHKPYAMVLILDKNYAKTLMGQPPRCYRVSLQAQAYGDMEILMDLPPEAFYPPPRVQSCLLKIVENSVVLPKNFWAVVNHHWEHFPTPQVQSPKTVGLRGWIELAEKSKG